MFGAVTLIKNTDPDKYGYIGYGIGFYSRSQLLWSDGSWGKSAVVFGADMSCSVLVDDKKKNILVLCEDLSQELDDTRTTAEAKYPINFTRSRRRFKQQFFIC